jgi:hypothetical protein
MTRSFPTSLPITDVSFWKDRLGIVFRIGSPEPVGHVGATHVPAAPKGRAS